MCTAFRQTGLAGVLAAALFGALDPFATSLSAQPPQLHGPAALAEPAPPPAIDSSTLPRLEELGIGSDELGIASDELGIASDEREGLATVEPWSTLLDPHNLPSRARPFAPRANLAPDTQNLMQNYVARVEAQRADLPSASFVQPGPGRLWWDEMVRQSIQTTELPLRVTLGSLCVGALQHSSYVQVVTTTPQIYESELLRENAAFAWRSFLETTYNDVNEPVANTLTTGTAASRYKDQSFSLDTGVRRRLPGGGQLEAFQRYGDQRNNSRFLAPNPQRTTRLQLQYTQPLLRGAGRAYNQSQIVLAKLQVGQSSDEVTGQLQDHLLRISEAYWQLYRTRAEYLQRQKLLRSAEAILDNLEARRGLDAVQRQVFRAKTAVAKRRSEMIRAETEIRNLQSQLRLLVNDPQLVQAGNRELAPCDALLMQHVELDLTQSLHTALANRPDISRAIRAVRQSSVELHVAHKDVLPQLDLVANTYVAGLSAGSTKQALNGQFSQGRPSYSLGLQFEVPFGNRAARAEEQRRSLILSRELGQFRLTVEEALTSVEVAVREVDAAYRELCAKYEAMSAAEREAMYLQDRWQIVPGIDDSAAQLLENLLDAQERVADEEGATARAQIAYAISMLRLKQEMGILLRADDTAFRPTAVPPRITEATP
ncbi:MAG: TolC family protein [Planctomycetales bacterium]|nr:TolC family protein [Planctomycetales bacterium]